MKWSIAFACWDHAEAHRKKLRDLAKAGVTQFNIYLMCGEEEQTLDDYQRDVLPEFLKAKEALTR